MFGNRCRLDLRTHTHCIVKNQELKNRQGCMGPITAQLAANLPGHLKIPKAPFVLLREQQSSPWSPWEWASLSHHRASSQPGRPANGRQDWDWGFSLTAQDKITRKKGDISHFKLPLHFTQTDALPKLPKILLLDFLTMNTWNTFITRSNCFCHPQSMPKRCTATWDSKPRCITAKSTPHQRAKKRMDFWRC